MNLAPVLTLALRSSLSRLEASSSPTARSYALAAVSTNFSVTIERLLCRHMKCEDTR